MADLATAVTSLDALPADLREREVSAVVQDSRRAVPGSLFVAVRGFHSDGHQFISQALLRGAEAAVAERVPAGVPADRIILVADSRRALALLAVRFFGDPSAKLKVAGITGTKGKTTTSYLVRSIVEASGLRTGLIGTIDYRIGDTVYPAPNTTPESLELQALLAEMVAQSATHCVMEVSSHALALGRTDGCRFAAAAFTNLQPEHLDFHPSMDDYFEAKLKLFTGLGPDQTAVVNRDDPRCGEILARTNAKVITYGRSGSADVRPGGVIGHGSTGIRFRAVTPIGEVGIDSRLAGAHNISNILAAVGMGVALGCPCAAIEEGIRRMTAVPGRMERIDEGQPFGVFVDYAHTDESLAALLRAVGDIGGGRVITVFGCGGDRDRTKRPRMGAAALAGSDAVIVTSDNPRTEDPLAIIRDIETGMSAGRKVSRADELATPGASTPYLVVADRAAAIEAAIGLARPGDIVVLAGKGHEDYQIVGAEKHHFDDREEARKAIAKRLAA